ncbi:hypothetical protein FPCIR_4580 [Fusarium pseudocircinatum]|uniref:Uncharacterized protein n=1 Tax=Fusarium pseudocircinatum TaxID=56676 RepID=A0A8H5PDS3_9HYPO|nr:hypothetical protein FPCIR_4580 [Fusarium pseudocircinatum]
MSDEEFNADSPEREDKSECLCTEDEGLRLMQEYEEAHTRRREEMILPGKMVWGLEKENLISLTYRGKSTMCVLNSVALKPALFDIITRLSGVSTSSVTIDAV